MLIQNRVESCDLRPTFQDDKDLFERFVSTQEFAQIPVTSHVNYCSNTTTAISPMSHQPSAFKTIPLSPTKTIPIEKTSSKSSANSQNPTSPQENSIVRTMMDEAKSRVMELPNKVGPWMQFFSPFSIPNSSNELIDRLKANLNLYYANYAIISAILLLYCLITSPILFLIFGIVAALSFFIISSAKTLQLGENAFTPQQQLLVLVCVTIPIFILLGIHSVFFWVTFFFLFFSFPTAKILKI